MKDDPESTLIKFNTKDKASYAHYVQAMDNYLAKYSNTNNTRKCDGKDSNQQITVDGNNAKAIQDAKVFSVLRNLFISHFSRLANSN